VRSHSSVESALRLLAGEIEQIHVLDTEQPDSSADTGDEAS